MRPLRVLPLLVVIAVLAVVLATIVVVMAGNSESATARQADYCAQNHWRYDALRNVCVIP